LIAFETTWQQSDQNVFPWKSIIFKRKKKTESFDSIKMNGIENSANRRNGIATKRFLHELIEVMKLIV